MEKPLALTDAECNRLVTLAKKKKGVLTVGLLRRYFRAYQIAKKLMEANEKVDVEAATKIADVLPKSPELMKTLLLRKKVELNDEEIAALLKIVG